MAAELSWAEWGFVQLSCLAVPSGAQHKSALGCSDPVLAPAPALGSCSGEGTQTFLRKHMVWVWISIEPTVLYFSSSSSSCRSPHCNIEEKVDGKRKEFLHTLHSVIFSVCSRSVMGCQYHFLDTCRDITFPAGWWREETSQRPEWRAKALQSLCSDFLFPILSDKGRKASIASLLRNIF